jgi:hypothetical protein
MNKLIVGFLLSFLLAASASAFGAEPRRDILGLRLGMSTEAAHTQLQKIGRLERNERKRQEVWEVRDRHFTHLIVGFDKAGQVRFVTAVARENGERMRYSDVADLKKARQLGDAAINNYHYVWELAAKRKEMKSFVVARGRDPQYLTTYSIKRAD